MKINQLMQECRQLITPEIDKQVELSTKFANRVYDILEERGMTQRDLSERTGKTEAEISRLLSGTHNLTLSTISKICVALQEDIISFAKERKEAGFVMVAIPIGKAFTLPQDSQDSKKNQTYNNNGKTFQYFTRKMHGSKSRVCSV